jgi:hypothetical protein
MFLLRIIVFIAIIILTLPYLKKGANAVMKRIPSEISNPINKTIKQGREITKQVKESSKK